MIAWCPMIYDDVYNISCQCMTNTTSVGALVFVRSLHNMATPQKPDGSDKEAVIQYADQLYEQEQWKELFQYLQEVLGSDNDPELVWRLLRCGFRLGQQLLKAGNSRETEHIADIAMERGRRALEKNDRNFGLHKVYTSK